MFGPRQFFFTQCGPGKPNDWTRTLYTGHIMFFSLLVFGFEAKKFSQSWKLI